MSFIRLRTYQQLVRLDCPVGASGTKKCGCTKQFAILASKIHCSAPHTEPPFVFDYYPLVDNAPDSKLVIEHFLSARATFSSRKNIFECFFPTPHIGKGVLCKTTMITKLTARSNPQYFPRGHRVAIRIHSYPSMQMIELPDSSLVITA